MTAKLEDHYDAQETPDGGLLFTPKGPQSPAIIRTQDHRYYYEGAEYPGVTSILKVLDKSDGLVPWAARETAKAAVALTEAHPLALRGLLDTVGSEGAVKALADRSKWTRDEAAHLGSQVHEYAQVLVEGATDIVIPPAAVSRAKAYAEWWDASGWTLRLAEALVVNPSVGYGGTFDLLARDRDGRTVLADVKTGKGVYREAILQLAAYGMAPLVARPGDARAYPMPLPDRYVILHVTEDNVREIEVSVGQAEKMAFLDCLDLLRWTQSVKGRL